MKFTGKIFERATVGGMADYLLFGENRAKETRDYETRLNEAYQKYEEYIRKYEKEQQKEIGEVVDELIGEITNIYMEIGLQTGILFMQDMTRNVEIEKQDNKADYQKMYYSLFREISNALKIMEGTSDKIAKEASDILKNSQCRTEEIYLSNR